MNSSDQRMNEEYLWEEWMVVWSAPSLQSFEKSAPTTKGQLWYGELCTTQYWCGKKCIKLIHKKSTLPYLQLLILLNSDFQSLNRVPPDVVVPIWDKGQKFGETASSKNPVVEWLRPLSAVLCGYIRRGRDKSQHFLNLFFLVVQYVFLWWLQRREGDCYEGPLSLCRSLVQTRAPQIEISNEILNEI